MDGPAHSHESPEQRDARLQAEWDALTPKEQAVRRRQWSLEFIAEFEAYVDGRLASRAGRDGPLYHGGPGREREVIGASVLGHLRSIKEHCATEAARIRNGAALF